MDFDLDDAMNGEEEEKKEGPERKDFLSNILSVRTPSLIDPCDLDSVMRMTHFKVDVDSDYTDGSTFVLLKTLPGDIRVLGALSRIHFNLSRKSVTLGWGQFRQRRTGLIPTDPEGLGEVKKFKEATSLLTHLPLQSIKFSSMEGVQIFATAQGDGKKGDSVEGYIIFTKL